eukprot:CAMPEP_0178428296 /NCGR_PEP_ID=MMETSP0689_2-20121128/30203_1 /TAXON_ID=160604 /ORGANISM="Amphidinium massartii, Strain CS-259" /LENGTH=105 /DNA_ID=CAMNT_0020050061 /DNA_START=585 /DNA_END=902 /DNA_ORIENTATION=+
MNRTGQVTFVIANVFTKASVKASAARVLPSRCVATARSEAKALTSIMPPTGKAEAKCTASPLPRERPHKTTCLASTWTSSMRKCIAAIAALRKDSSDAAKSDSRP